MSLYIYTYISKHHLLILYNVICIHVFMDGHSVLDNQSLCSSPGKTTVSSPIILMLSVVLFVGLRFCGLSPTHLACLLTFRSAHNCAFILARLYGHNFCHSRGTKFNITLSVLLAFMIFLPFFCNVP